MNQAFTQVRSLSDIPIRIFTDCDLDAVVAAPVHAVLFVECDLANPQGDPRLGNRPRTNRFDGHGEITPQGLKRQIRDYVLAQYGDISGMSIHIARKAVLEENILALAQSKGLSPGGELREALLSENWDNRTFGTVITGKSLTKLESVVGPVQVSTGVSIVPVQVQSKSITRNCISSGDERDKMDEFNQTMGVQYSVRGLYAFRIFVTPVQGVKFTYRDMDVLFDAMLRAWQWRPTSTKLGMATRKLVLFKHSNPKGNMLPHQAAKLVKVTPKSELPSFYEDYEIEVSTAVPDGVTVQVIDQ